MAVAYTVTDTVRGLGPLQLVFGTFTSAAGDGNGETLTATTHGLNRIWLYQIKLDAGAIDAQTPKVSVSAGTLTWTVDDTQGLSGTWCVLGQI